MKVIQTNPNNQKSSEKEQVPPQLFCFLNEKQKAKLKVVNKYWKQHIEETHKYLKKTQLKFFGSCFLLINLSSKSLSQSFFKKFIKKESENLQKLNSLKNKNLKEINSKLLEKLKTENIYSIYIKNSLNKIPIILKLISSLREAIPKLLDPELKNLRNKITKQKDPTKIDPTLKHKYNNILKNKLKGSNILEKLKELDKFSKELKAFLEIDKLHLFIKPYSNPTKKILDDISNILKEKQEIIKYQKKIYSKKYRLEAWKEIIKQFKNLLELIILQQDYSPNENFDTKRFSELKKNPNKTTDEKKELADLKEILQSYGEFIHPIISDSPIYKKAIKLSMDQAFLHLITLYFIYFKNNDIEEFRNFFKSMLNFETKKQNEALKNLLYFIASFEAQKNLINENEEISNIIETILKDLSELTEEQLEEHCDKLFSSIEKFISDLTKKALLLLQLPNKPKLNKYQIDIFIKFSLIANMLYKKTSEKKGKEFKNFLNNSLKILDKILEKSITDLFNNKYQKDYFLYLENPLTISFSSKKPTLEKVQEKIYIINNFNKIYKKEMEKSISNLQTKNLVLNVATETTYLISAIGAGIGAVTTLIFPIIYSLMIGLLTYYFPTTLPILPGLITITLLATISFVILTIFFTAVSIIFYIIKRNLKKRESNPNNDEIKVIIPGIPKEILENPYL